MAIELSGCAIESLRCIKMHTMYDMHTLGYIIFIPLYCSFKPLLFTLIYISKYTYYTLWYI